jgi:hypothetical protein
MQLIVRLSVISDIRISPKKKKNCVFKYLLNAATSNLFLSSYSVYSWVGMVNLLVHHLHNRLYVLYAVGKHQQVTQWATTLFHYALVFASKQKNHGKTQSGKPSNIKH